MQNHDTKLPAMVDVSVLLVFFIRSDTLQKVFWRIREARPSELFLYQDGPRANHPGDKEALMKCREIVARVDWECKVHRLYQEKNYGPDESGYLADTWAFSQTDKCIVLEDDVVPSLSAFSFMKAMLDRYEHDERVSVISGLNLEGQTTGVSEDYFFSYATFLSGIWASWSRVVRQWNPTYSFLDDESAVQKMDEHLRAIRYPGGYVKTLRRHRAVGVPRFESIMIATQRLNRGLTLVPTRNLAINIGVGGESAHFSAELKCMARGDRIFFELPIYEIDATRVKHPAEVKEYPAYQEEAYRMRAWGHPWIKIFRCLESFLLQIRYGQGKNACKTLGRQVVNFISRLIH